MEDLKQAVISAIRTVKSWNEMAIAEADPMTIIDQDPSHGPHWRGVYCR
jgi:hypothetical protein